LKWVKIVPKKRKNLSATKKINPPTNLPPPKLDETDLPFHIMFPLELQHVDNGDHKTCWFKDEIDLKKYIARYKLKPKQCTIQKTKPRK